MRLDGPVRGKECLLDSSLCEKTIGGHESLGALLVLRMRAANVGLATIDSTDEELKNSKLIRAELEHSGTLPYEGR